MLKKLRESKKMTQSEVAKLLGISLRTYQRYETNEQSIPFLKYDAIISKLNTYNQITETTGILSLDEIRTSVQKVLENYNIKYCYLFGSYAKGKATGSSDIDLFIDGENITGLDYYGLIEDLRKALNKKIDLINRNDFNANEALQNEILKDGIKIYG